MATPDTDRPQYKILVVEDNPFDRSLYKRFLSRSGIPFVVREAASVNEGLELSREENVDCILVDYKLPDADGIDFIKSCQNQKLQPDAAIIMVTGQGDEQTAVEAMKLGALDYIAKNSVMEGFFVQDILNAIERASLRRQVREYQAELERSYAALSEFTHTVSHDLKAPLRRIGQYCELLKEEMGDRLGVEEKEYVERLCVNAKRLQKLVDDLLIFARTMNPKEEKTPVDMGLLAAEVVDIFDAVIKESGAAVTVDGLPTVPVYPMRMKELLQNLVDNALKYKGRDKPVIKISAREEKDSFTISVSDNGEGIDPKHHDSIFKAFERLHPQDEIEGSGLGLSICRKVVELHGGRIWVESTPGGGATFRFTIPKK